jgi:hypothetical protein
MKNVHLLINFFFFNNNLNIGIILSNAKINIHLVNNSYTIFDF